MKRKLLIIGHARHGKDTVAEFFRELHGYTFQSSSSAAADIFLYESLKEKYGYQDYMECYADRVNKRKEWHDAICEFNAEDKARLAKEIMRENDIYVGMRSDVECQECLEQGVFDFVIGVYNPRVPYESKESFDINIWKESNLIIPNAGTLEELKERVWRIGRLLAS